MSTDNDEVDQFLNTAPVTIPQWADRELLWFPDVNNGQYSTQVVFDGMTAVNSWNAFAEAYLVIPLAVSSSTTTPYTSSTVVGPREGIQGIFTGLSFGDEVSVWFNENSGQTPLINAVRATLDHSMEWAENEAKEQMFTPTDSSYIATDCTAALATPGAGYGLNFQPLAGAAGSNVEVGATISTSVRNPLYNRAAEETARQFALQCPFNSTLNAFCGNVIIPLKSLHNFFEQLPILKSFHMKMTLFFAGAYQPFFAANGAPAPKITIGANGTGLTQCQLYYPAVTPTPALASKLEERLKSYKRVIKYLACDYFGQSVSNNTQQSVSQVISQSICSPQRVWCFAVPTGALTASNSWSPLMGAATFSSVNIVLGGRQYLNFPLSRADMFWSQIKSVLPMSGVSDCVSGLISWEGQLANRRWVVVNTSRMQNDRDVTTPTTLQWVSNRADSGSGAGGAGYGPCDYIWLVERSYAVTIANVGGSIRMTGAGVLG